MGRIVATGGIWFEAQEHATERNDDLDQLLYDFLRHYIEGPAA